MVELLWLQDLLYLFSWEAEAPFFFFFDHPEAEAPYWHCF